MSTQSAYIIKSDTADTRAPSNWTLENEEEDTKIARIKRDLEISGTRVKHNGQGEYSERVLAIRANFPVPENCPFYVFEIQVLWFSENGAIGIGFSVDKVNLEEMPGWNINTYGYHGDNGKKYTGKGKGDDYGPTFTTGDTISAIWDREKREISFSKNGDHLGVAFTDVSEEILYPIVGLHKKDTEIKANFGENQFLLDVDSLLAEKKRAMSEQISKINLEEAFKIELDKVLPSIVTDYLIHHRYWKTLSVMVQEDHHHQFDNSENIALKNLESINNRQKIYDAVTSGHIDEAILNVDAVAPGSFKKYPSLLFKLHIQKFIEMVKNKKDQHSAIQYGKTFLSPACENTEDIALLQDAMTLIAYEDPEESPCRYLLDPKSRISIAEELNDVILEYEGKPKTSMVETIYKQIELLLEKSKEEKDMGIQFIDADNILHRT